MVRARAVADVVRACVCACGVFASPPPPTSGSSGEVEAATSSSRCVVHGQGRTARLADAMQPALRRDALAHLPSLMYCRMLCALCSSSKQSASHPTVSSASSLVVLGDAEDDGTSQHFAKTCDATMPEENAQKILRATCVCLLCSLAPRLRLMCLCVLVCMCVAVCLSCHARCSIEIS